MQSCTASWHVCAASEAKKKLPEIHLFLLTCLRYLLLSAEGCTYSAASAMKHLECQETMHALRHAVEQAVRQKMLVGKSEEYLH